MNSSSGYRSKFNLWEMSFLSLSKCSYCFLFCYRKHEAWIWTIPSKRTTSESISKLFILRKRKKQLPALYSARACTLTEWSAFGLGIHACWLRCKAKQSTLLYISETFPTDSVLFEVFLGQGYSLVCSMRLKKIERRKEGRKTQAIFCSLSTLECNALWRLNRRPCTTAVTAEHLDRNTLVKQKEE